MYTSLSSDLKKIDLKTVQAQYSQKTSGVPLGKPFGFIFVCALPRINDFAWVFAD
jgi:hypothetical protein